MCCLDISHFYNFTVYSYLPTVDFPKLTTDGIMKNRHPIRQIAIPAITNTLVIPIASATNPVANNPGIEGISIKLS